MDEPPQPRADRGPLAPPGGVEPYAADMGVVASADATLGDVDAALASLEVPQWLPIDGPAGMTVGEAVTTDTTGPLRLGYGGWRDRLTGVQFQGGDGGLVTHGGLPVKNVAGYDLTKLLVGSFGAIGRPITVTARTVRRPTDALVATVPVPDDVPAHVNALLTGRAPPQWMLLTRGGLRAGWLGSGEEIDRLAEDVDGDRRTFAEDAADRAALLDVGDDELRAVIPPSAAALAMRELSSPKLTIDPAFGVVRTTPDDADAVAALCGRVGGHALVLRGDGGFRRVAGGPDPAAAAVARRLKERLDPDGRLPALPM